MPIDGCRGKRRKPTTREEDELKYLFLRLPGGVLSGRYVQAESGADGSSRQLWRKQRGPSAEVTFRRRKGPDGTTYHCGVEGSGIARFTLLMSR